MNARAAGRSIPTGSGQVLRLYKGFVRLAVWLLKSTDWCCGARQGRERRRFVIKCGGTGETGGIR